MGTYWRTNQFVSFHASSCAHCLPDCGRNQTTFLTQKAQKYIVKVHVSCIMDFLSQKNVLLSETGGRFWILANSFLILFFWCHYMQQEVGIEHVVYLFNNHPLGQRE